jgi:glycopeptide antibiotics resistance protein
VRALLWLLVILISYGSLYPFSFAAHEGSLEELGRLFTAPNLNMGRGDLVGNLLLFVPYGFIAALLARQRHHPHQQLVWLLVNGAVLALALQIIQIWLPSRVPALVDVFANLGGMAIGVALAGLLPRLLPRQVQSALGSENSAQALFAGTLMLCWLSDQWFPLVPTLDLQNLLNALKPLLQTLQPDPVRTLHTTCAWLAFFWLTKLLFKQPPGLIPIAVASLLILAGKLFIVGAIISASNVFALALALAASPLLQRHYGLNALIVLMLLSLFVSGFSPFALRNSPQTFHWIPFTGMLEGDMGNNLLNLIEKSYFYGALILLIHVNGARPLPAAIAAASCLLLIEGAQLFLAGRTAESTDPVLALLLGFALQQTFSTNSARSRPARRQ